jgi:hypothetical protein
MRRPYKTLSLSLLDKPLREAISPLKSLAFLLDKSSWPETVCTRELSPENLQKANRKRNPRASNLMHQFSTAESYDRAFPKSTTATPQRPQRYYAKLLDHSKNDCERILSSISPNPRVGTLGRADRKIDLRRTKKNS